jgi:hypothetical protein
MKKAYGLAQTSDNERAATLESINKYVKAIIAMEKAIAESPNASHDVQVLNLELQKQLNISTRLI